MDSPLLTRQFISLIIANFCFWSSLNIFLPVLPQYFHLLGRSDFEIGIVTGALSCGGLLLRMIAGKLTDKYGSVILVCAGYFFSFIAINGYMYAQNIYLAITSAFIHGVSMAFYSGAALTMATLMFKDSLLPDVFTWYTFMGMAGSSIAMGISTWLFKAGGIKAVIYVGLSLLIIGFFLVPKHPILNVKTEEKSIISMKSITSNPGVYVPSLNLFATNLGFSGTITFLPILMLTKGIENFNAFFISYALVVLLARFNTKRLSTILGIYRLELISIILTAIALLIIVIADNNFLLILCGITMGLAQGVAFPIMGTTVTSSVTPANRGVALGLLTTAADCGFMIGATGLGLIAAYWGHSIMFLSVGCYVLIYGLIYKYWLHYKELDLSKENLACIKN